MPGAHSSLLLLFQGNVVVLVHSSEDSEDEENELVVNSLCHHSDLILWAQGLATGFCKDVHGQVRHSTAQHRQVARWHVSLSPAALQARGCGTQCGCSVVKD